GHGLTGSMPGMTLSLRARRRPVSGSNFRQADLPRQDWPVHSRRAEEAPTKATLNTCNKRGMGSHAQRRRESERGHLLSHGSSSGRGGGKGTESSPSPPTP
ncbi:MAG: hypothetical protein PVH19_05090, partial [Planctomycetia bacterium]